VAPEGGSLRWMYPPMGIPTVDIDDGDPLFRVLTPVQPGQ